MRKEPFWVAIEIHQARQRKKAQDAILSLTEEERKAVMGDFCGRCGRHKGLEVCECSGS